MKIHFCSSKNPLALNAFSALTAHYGQTAELKDTDVVVSLGGDGTLIFFESGQPIQVQAETAAAFQTRGS